MGKVRYCSASGKMFFEDQDLHKLGPHTFGFAESGLFTLLNKRGLPLYDISLPLFQKMASHLLWIIFWALLILLVPYSAADRIFMSLIFVHLFLIGCRLTHLMLYGGLKPLLRPPLWVKLTRQKDLDLLKKYHLDDHPGLLSNLALHQKDPAKARHYMTQALALCPEHPILQQISQQLDSIETIG